MELSSYPVEVQAFIQGLINEGVIKENDIIDRTFINYLYTQRFDKDYIDSMRHDR